MVESHIGVTHVVAHDDENVRLGEQRGCGRENRQTGEEIAEVFHAEEDESGCLDHARTCRI
jgi:hypothetical protein